MVEGLPGAGWKAAFQGRVLARSSWREQAGVVGIGGLSFAPMFHVLRQGCQHLDSRSEIAG
jgi:hypothetical protein